MTDVLDDKAALALLDRLIREVTGMVIAPDANFFEAGVDSIQLVEIHTRLVAALDRELPLWLLFMFTNMNTLATRLVDDVTALPPRSASPPAAPAGHRHSTAEERRELRARIRQEGR
ncbi:acyl carrier protein [Nonomuraea sp. MG754425]|uniref:acyl carrier protein n=1 Tax=Nonomuraea sp. MG754425 TaxID=2570319 RepID=UPI001F3C5BD1|nr:acyl carrier protein [Nonomuraea sp. MG754425]MCF6473386.1 acyl carrier protein [Nonomuraea sp. MG754425]